MFQLALHAGVLADLLISIGLASYAGNLVVCTVFAVTLWRKGEE